MVVGMGYAHLLMELMGVANGKCTFMLSVICGVKTTWKDCSIDTSFLLVEAAAEKLTVLSKGVEVIDS